jgi:hypothetical protein
MLGGLVVLVLAVPLCLVAGAGLGPWLLGAGLWIAGEAVAFLLTRLPLGLSNLGASGAVGVGLIFRQVVAGGVLVAVLVQHKDLAVGAALVYAAAYTSELGLSMLGYFAGDTKPS